MVVCPGNYSHLRRFHQRRQSTNKNHMLSHIFNITNSMNIFMQTPMLPVVQHRQPPLHIQINCHFVSLPDLDLALPQPMHHHPIFTPTRQLIISLFRRKRKNIRQHFFTPYSYLAIYTIIVYAIFLSVYVWRHSLHVLYELVQYNQCHIFSSFRHTRKCDNLHCF